MLRHDFRALFRFVLATTATSACGGLVEPDEPVRTAERNDEKCAEGCEDDTSSDGSSSSSSTSGGSSSSSTSGGSSSSTSGGSSSSSGSTSGGSSSSSSGTSGSSGGSDCGVGNVAPTESFCCPEGQRCDSALPADPVTGSCAVDCARVCAQVAPDAPTGFFTSCYWTDETHTELGYACGLCGVGRVAAGTEPYPLGGSLGERLARQAYYEAASVTAFARLARALEVGGAPWDLVRRADQAAAEESRHAATFAALATKHGAKPCAPEAATRNPTLFELALENATEGCVRETFGALVTLHQAEHAETAEVRAAFASIAEDELAHAAFSWDLFAWFDAVLGAEERTRMHHAYEIARRAAEREVAEAPSQLDAALGLPSAPRAKAMFQSLMRGMEALRELRAAA